MLNHTHATSRASPKKRVRTGWISIIKKKHTARISISIAKSKVKITKYCGTFIFDLINLGKRKIKPSIKALKIAPIPKLVKMVTKTFGKLKVFIKVNESKEEEKNKAITKSTFTGVVGTIVLNFSTNFIIFV